MALAALLLQELDDETKSTRSLLACVPDGKADWKPHEKSMTLGRLATHVAELAGRPAIVLGQEEWDPLPQGPAGHKPRTLGSRREILETFETGAEASRRALAAASDTDLAAPFTFKRAGTVIYTVPRFVAYRRMAVNHLVHHRAQLGVYLRLLGVEIPGAYGPSADDIAKMQRKQ